jgi:hypothetical protein
LWKTPAAARSRGTTMFARHLGFSLQVPESKSDFREGFEIFEDEMSQVRELWTSCG